MHKQKVTSYGFNYRLTMKDLMRYFYEGSLGIKFKPKLIYYDTLKIWDSYNFSAF